MCLVGAAALYIAFDFNAPVFGGVPWLVLLLGLVLIWTAMSLKAERANFIGAIMAIVGAGLTIQSPWWILYGTPWLILVGLAFPLLVGIVNNVALRCSKRPLADGHAR